MHLGWFCTTGFGVYGWDQPWSGNAAADVGNPQLFVDLATSLERAGFDYIMLEDASALPDKFRGNFERSVKSAIHVRFDPMPVVPLMAAATEHIGIIATIATTFYPPFLAARLFQTLDHVTKGRVGINLVTASAEAAAQNYGLEKHVEHDLRYEMADEWVEVCKELWGSWEDGAWMMEDKVGGVFADHTKIHHINHKGRFHASRGPLNMPPGPQGTPVLCQAGGSPAGRTFGAKHADTIIASPTGIEGMREYREDISRQAVEFGRKPDDIKVLYLVNPIIADTDDDAFRKRDRIAEAKSNDVEGLLAALSYSTSMDFSKFDVDGPLPDMSANNGHQSGIKELFSRGNTLREIAASYRTAQTVELCGSPETVADRMGEIMEEVGGDGFLISAPVTRKNITEIADGLAPALRRKGLIRSKYEYPTFRDNLLSS